MASRLGSLTNDKAFVDHVSAIALPAAADRDGAMFSGLGVQAVLEINKTPIALFEKDKEPLVWNRGLLRQGRHGLWP